LAMTSDTEPQLKYSYKFRLEAKQPQVFDEEVTKSEVQSYINDLLGVKDKPLEKNRTSV